VAVSGTHRNYADLALRGGCGRFPRTPQGRRVDLLRVWADGEGADESTSGGRIRERQAEAEVSAPNPVQAHLSERPRRLGGPLPRPRGKGELRKACMEPPQVVLQAAPRCSAGDRRGAQRPRGLSSA